MTKYVVEEIYGGAVVSAGVVLEDDPIKAAEILAGQPVSARALQDHWFRVVDEDRAAVYEYSLVGPDQRPDLSGSTKLSDLGLPIAGTMHGGGFPRDEDHFYNCPSCGQKVDQRDLRQVMWHEVPGHEPLETEPATILSFPRPK
ncbi:MULTISPECIES: hypothetical protein [unclassified Mesorhizobium]|uniref:hypothetical protein n=1 Tax=unclassified Mesorhizobium TaxID=325217 RepID=UPI000FDB8B00|nr:MULTISPECIES: hypothetical protein [unclassified Mesorhizobium]TGR58243.1 hypothetical protein EN842_01225 [bacterium M00.F.Ca.ET.199.01.1.1]TGU41649.1 hypothetical protein EN799_03590 [bacterium M00.F.Ca.ET.156.01.1.1]TGV89727.1 hypothetical protein EN792_006095 [Mesorhizobium sp. M00.F.Ca.ET.149.01.1.1]TGR32985.1 hypothetical protein EN840_01225 [Mesorhizobium sp. M8A.F.Ca.ET.197.01.1.1]TGR34631.1 hypothetical protein EN845_01225 [Mesorhizobium sp. M8A.F.Ca.ET.202.01.1.1]